MFIRSVARDRRVRSAIDDRQDARRSVKSFEGSSGGHVNLYTRRRRKFLLELGAGPIEEAKDDTVRREHGLLE
jgi:hypothetical protein